MMLPLIPSWVLVIVVAFAIYVQLKQRRYEHAFTRSLIFWLYMALTLFPMISSDTARVFNRYFLILLFVIEIASFYFFAKGRPKR